MAKEDNYAWLDGYSTDPRLAPPIDTRLTKADGPEDDLTEGAENVPAAASSDASERDAEVTGPSASEIEAERDAEVTGPSASEIEAERDAEVTGPDVLEIAAELALAKPVAPAGEKPARPQSRPQFNSPSLETVSYTHLTLPTTPYV